MLEVEHLTVVLAHKQDTHRSVRDEVPETGLLVATDAAGDVPEEVAVEIVHPSLGDLTALGGVLEAVPADAHTQGRREPLTEVEVRSNTHLAQAVTLLEEGVDTGTEGDEGVIESTVGHVRTTDHVAIRVAVGILLRKGVEGEEKACRSKDSTVLSIASSNVLQVS